MLILTPAMAFGLAIEPEASHSPWPIANLPDCAGRLNSSKD
jgi:hypothetical protein